jgi:ATP-dependent exoDNAse (exonuclease V) beta subunit
MSLPDEFARRQALTAIDRTMLVEAGAGSGKTAILAGRIAILLASGIAPKHIAAITFTEFAASELLIRVERYVRELRNGTIPRELAGAFGHRFDDQQRNLAIAADNLDQLTCTTIHGFAQALLRPYPAEANIDPGADIIDPAEADLAFAEQFDAWLKQHLSGENEDDVVAQLVLADEGQALALVNAIAQFLKSNRAATTVAGGWRSDLWRQFSDAVADFRRQLDRSGFREETTDSYLDGFAQLAAELARFNLSRGAPTNADLIGALAVAHCGPCFTGGGGPRQFRVLGRWRDAARNAGLSAADGERACAAAGRCYDACHEACEALMTGAAGEVLRRLYDALAGLMTGWRDYKRSAALLDFDDLLYTARDLLADHEPVRRALAERFQHVLVDEFQDTDPIQIEILWRVCGEPSPRGSDDWMARQLRPGALFLVGDPKQAIYRFRGADVNAYIAARQAIGPAALCQIIANFRSRKPILDFVNQRFAPALSESRGQPGFAALRHTIPASGEPAVVALDVAVPEDDISVDRRRAAEAERVTELCGRLIGNRLVRDPETDEMRLCRAGDIALLAPAGTDLWRYEEALEEAGIPVSTQAGKSLFRRQEIQDLIALTRALADPRDTLALGALLRGPLVGLSEGELLDIAEALPADPQQPARPSQLYLWTDPAQVAHPLARDALSRLQSIAIRARSTTPHLLLADAVEALSVRPQLRQRHRAGADRALANVDLYLDMARAYDVRGLRAFARDMRANWEDAVRQVEGRPDAAQQSVALITMHAAKGLEWPVVIPINTMGPPYEDSTIVYDRGTGRFSTAIRGVVPAGHDGIAGWVVAEQGRERVRLWYVAATRARDLLVLPRHSPDLRTDSWGCVVDLGLAALPAIDQAALPARIVETGQPIDNPQSRDVFADEAKRIAAATSKIQWQRPSRDEGGGAAATPERAVVTGSVVLEQADEWPIPEVASGAMRGTILHKLMEEVLTGETPDDHDGLLARSAKLLSQLGIEPASDPREGIAPVELAATVLQTLALPEVAALRPHLVPESAVFAHQAAAGAETLVSGVADAVALDETGSVEAVIDWKSDIAPSAAQLENYRAQLKTYCECTGARCGLLILMSLSRSLEIGGARKI